MHAEAFVAENVPAGHNIPFADPAGQYEPAGQGVGAFGVVPVRPPKHIEPAGHIAQLVVEDWKNFPAGQLLQLGWLVAPLVQAEK